METAVSVIKKGFFGQSADGCCLFGCLVWSVIWLFGASIIRLVVQSFCLSLSVVHSAGSLGFQLFAVWFVRLISVFLSLNFKI